MKLIHHIMLPGFLAIAAGAFAADQQVYRSAAVASRWLNIPSSARVAGLAGAFAARGAEPGGIEANPAALAGIQDWQALFTHNSWVQGMQSERILFAMNAACLGTFAVGFDYLGLGAMERVEVTPSGDAVEQGKIHPNALTLMGAYAYDFGHLAAGISARYIDENWVDSENSGFQTDLGARWTADNGWRVGASLKSVSLDFSTALRPLSLRAGTGYTIAGERPLALDANIDWQTQDQETPSFRFAGEWAASNNFILRAGYIAGNDRTPSGPTLGIGWIAGSLELDYAFYGAGDLGYSHLVSLRLVPLAD